MLLDVGERRCGDTARRVTTWCDYFQGKRSKTTNQTHAQTNRRTPSASQKAEQPTFVARPPSVLGSIFSTRMASVVATIPTPIWTAANTGIGSSDPIGWLTQVLATLTMRSEGKKMPYTICRWEVDAAATGFRRMSKAFDKGGVQGRGKVVMKSGDDYYSDMYTICLYFRSVV